MTGALTVRELGGLDELARTPPLARSIWGEADAPEDPILLHVLQHVGGLIAGAVDGQGQVWAYLVGLPTAQPDTQHSHRLGVHPRCRRQGLGERLKHFQRAWCLERGVTRVRWTFDPLLLANAHLNIHRLGAAAVTYLPNYYGEMTGINAGVPSDRFEVEWQLDSERVTAHLNGHAGDNWPAGEAFDPLHDGLPAETPDALAVRVPADYYRMLREEPGRALEWRRRTRPLFDSLFQAGHALVDVDVAHQQYLFRRRVVC
ncbi:GNAT family N-acetyltransferase [Deinococcus apachensis]|uniref:GNAT family N-acetyltransferase n=1 Tax=Deinococcus apachensis TaxID=309886 RepID=UPI00035EE67B|nr:GNAT family N-acetyltransferase [Deinococcus apachensis]